MPAVVGGGRGGRGDSDGVDNAVHPAYLDNSLGTVTMASGHEQGKKETEDES